MIERATPTLAVTLVWHGYETAPDHVRFVYQPYVNRTRLDDIITIVWRSDRMVSVTRLRDNGRHVIKSSGFVPEYALDVCLRTMFQLREGDTLHFRERFTHYVPCESCGAEIYATRLKPGNAHYWANRLDAAPHDCSSFRGMHKEVQPWTRYKGRHRKSSERRPTN